jgi:Ca2+-binding RTX toxin-like protein
MGTILMCRGLRAGLLGLLFAALTLALPALAQAAPSHAAVVGGPNLDVGPESFGDQENHQITISYEGGAYRATDTAGVVAESGCSQVNPTTVSCPDDGIVAVVPFGAAGNDTITVESIGPGDETGIHGFAGNDRLTGASSEDFVVGYRGNDVLFGNGGADRMLGGPSPDTPDDDTLDGGPGPDSISGDSSSGGIGIDTVVYAGRPASEPLNVTVNGGVNNDGGSSDGSGDSVIHVENVVGGAGDDLIEDAGGFGVLKDNIFRGGAGNDTLISNEGSDVLFGEAGADRLQAGRSADRLNGGDDADLLNGDDGPDLLFGDDGDDRLLSGPKQDRLTGGKGRDFMKGQGQKDHIFARDGQRDRRLDCGPGGRKESAQRDRIDPAPISC